MSRKLIGLGLLGTVVLLLAGSGRPAEACFLFFHDDGCGCSKPKVSCCKPAPVCAKPAPVCVRPAPVCAKPAPTCCKPAVIMMHVWSIGASMLIFLAALHRVPFTLYDAAQLDGAGAWGKFRHVTWPQITPVVLFNLAVCAYGFRNLWPIQNF